MSCRSVCSRSNSPGGLSTAGDASSTSGCSAEFCWRRFASQFATAPTMSSTATIQGLSNSPAANMIFMGMAVLRQDFAPGAAEDDGSDPSPPMFSRIVVSA